MRTTHTGRSFCKSLICRSYNAAREQEAQQRRAAEAEAFQRSQRILEQELARDRAWRDAVKQVL